ATAWAHFCNDTEKIHEHLATRDEKRQFNLGGAMEYFKQVEANLKGEIKTWAVKWYASIFYKNGLCLNPGVSLISNIGTDGSGQNSGTSSVYNIQTVATRLEVIPQ